MAEKVIVHRWPQDSPIWNDDIQKQLDDSIIKKNGKKQIKINDKTIQVEDIIFTSLQKIGITVPLFKEECTMIFEAQFKEIFAHVHITIKSKNFVEIFNQLTAWKKENFVSDS